MNPDPTDVTGVTTPQDPEVLPSIFKKADVMSAFVKIASDFDQRVTAAQATNEARAYAETRNFALRRAMELAANGGA
jgi:hypothetical protein